MKIRAYIQTRLLAVLLIGWGCLMVGCSDHADDETGPQHGQTGVPLNVAALTRSDAVEQADPLGGLSIYLYLKPKATENNTATETVSGQVSYGGQDTNGDIWHSSLKVKDNGDYQVFGYMPANITNEAPDVSISTSTATLTINNMSTVSNLDVCVITGVRGVEENANPDVLPSLFDYKATNIPNKGYGLSILADHIYAAATLSFKVGIDQNGGDYSKLRTIKLKQVILKNAKKKVNTIVTLKIGSEQTPFNDPIEAITVTDVEASAAVTATLFNSSEGKELKKDTSVDITGYFAPGKTEDLTIESIYNVYDTAGNLIREDCHAENKLNSKLSGLSRGQKKTITMTVIPTYLYVLSDPDADTPMVVAEETGD